MYNLPKNTTLDNPRYQKLLNLQDAYWIIDIKKNEEFGSFSLNFIDNFNLK